MCEVLRPSAFGQNSQSQCAQCRFAPQSHSVCAQCRFAPQSHSVHSVASLHKRRRAQCVKSSGLRPSAKIPSHSVHSVASLHKVTVCVHSVASLHKRRRAQCVKSSGLRPSAKIPSFFFLFRETHTFFLALNALFFWPLGRTDGRTSGVLRDHPQRMCA